MGMWVSESLLGLVAAVLLILFSACAGDSPPHYDPEGGAYDGDAGSADEEKDGDDEPSDNGGCIDAYPGQVLITEIMRLPATVTGKSGQYLELYNAGFDALAMNGWLLRDGQGGQDELALPAGESFGPGAHLLLAFEPDAKLNGGMEPDLVLSGIDLDTRLLILVAGEVEIDRVDFSAEEWPELPGASLNLDPSQYDLMGNDLPENWCAATEHYGDGDLGTPGLGNTICVSQLCGDGEAQEQEQCDDGQNGDDQDGCRDDCRYTCVDAKLDCGDVAGDCHGFECEPNDLGQVCVQVMDLGDLPPSQAACRQGGCDINGVPYQRNAVDGTACDNQTGLTGDICLGGLCLDPSCGDGIRAEGEECDDGNDVIGDGCTPDCVIELGICPLDMVVVPAAPAIGLMKSVCMDRYEASRIDATESNMGVESIKAVSLPGVIPWYVNPVDSGQVAHMQSACSAAGKRLCRPEEFYSACSQAGTHSYVFGDIFDREKCNCVDTFCDDYCAAQGIDPCSNADNCGYTYQCFHVVPTGSFASCTNSYGAYDLNGNVWEIVPSTTDPRGFEVRGGAFNCAGASARLMCSYNAGWTSLYAGFRCCRDF